MIAKNIHRIQRLVQTNTHAAFASSNYQKTNQLSIKQTPHLSETAVVQFLRYNTSPARRAIS